ncbi:hypothetical protein Tco_1123754 [Tanacetum coccineum]|uniref:Uncharacterized protein n=1 Tax=Tanacetum coccineum TaxID=301880 RepID=A0ABQ5J4J1_9ASTR
MNSDDDLWRGILFRDVVIYIYFLDQLKYKGSSQSSRLVNKNKGFPDYEEISCSLVLSITLSESSSFDAYFGNPTILDLID